jgi:hypothetical protein
VFRITVTALGNINIVFWKLCLLTNFMLMGLDLLFLRSTFAIRTLNAAVMDRVRLTGSTSQFWYFISPEQGSVDGILSVDKISKQKLVRRILLA